VRRQQGFWGQPKEYEQADASLRKRTHGRRDRHESSQRLPSGSGITEAACPTVFAQRLQRSGMGWTREGGQVILDLRVMGWRGVWKAGHYQDLGSQPVPVAQVKLAQGVQPEQKAA
jgi:hypothetical protein